MTDGGSNFAIVSEIALGLADLHRERLGPDPPGLLADLSRGRPHPNPPPEGEGILQFFGGGRLGLVAGVVLGLGWEHCL